MCRWRSWILPGLIAVALLTAMAMVFKSSSIEADLTKRATAGLAADGQGWASVNLNGRDATLQGTAPSPEAKVLAVQSADRVFGVRVVDDGAGVLPEEKPYRWSATRGADGAVTVSGFVHDDATRKAVVDAVGKALPGVAIKDDQKLARGAPAGLVGAAGFAAEQLGKLAEGSVTYQDQAMSATGRAATLDSYTDVTRTVASALPAGYSLASADIAPPNVSPYVWSAALATGGVTLTGLVPSEAARAEIVAAAKALVPTGSVTDSMKLAGGAPASYAASASYGLAQLARFSTGSVDLTDGALTVSGQAKTPADYTSALAALGALPAGATLAAGTVEPAVVPSWTFGIAKTRDIATLSGFVPSTAARDAIVAAIGSKIPGVTVADQTQLAAGLPATFGATADFGVSQLARLETGAFGLSSSGVTLEGQAVDPATRDTIASSLAAALPAGIVLQSQKITSKAPSPYVFDLKQAGDAIELTGYVPSEARRAALLAAVKAAAPAARVDDKTRLADGQPAGFDAAVDLGVDQLKRLGNTTVSVSDATLGVAGTAKSPTDYQAALAALAAAPAGATVTLKNITPATVTDWTFGVARGADQVTLTGYVPSDAARAEINQLAAAEFPGLKIDDKLQVAGGLPTGFGEAVRFGLGQLGRLDTGRLGLSKGGLSLEGEAGDPAVQDAIEASLKAGVPGGLGAAATKLTSKPPSPYVFAAAKIGNALSLNGYVPDQSTRATLVDEIKSRFGNVDVRDNLRVASGAPTGFVAAASAGVVGASRLENGTALVTDRSLTVTGGAFYAKAAEVIKADVTALLPQGWSTDYSGLAVLPPPPQVDRPTCQLRIDEVLGGNSIRFTTGRAEINPVSAGLLDQLVYAASRCTSNRIEISGHTDSDGTDENNQRLSEARAQAVSAYLADAGIDVVRLTALGLGEAQPIAANDTPENKAKNRRIEFKVLEQN